MLRIYAVLLAVLLQFSPSSAFATLTSGSVAYTTDCSQYYADYGLWVYKRQYWGSSPEVLGNACIAYYNLRLRQDKPADTTVFQLLTCQPGKCTFRTNHQTDANFFYNIVTTTVPGFATCNYSDLYDYIDNTCVGGPTCESGITKSLTVFDCAAADVLVGGICRPGTGLELNTFPDNLAFEGCEYTSSRPLVLNECWQSGLNRNIYCAADYISTGKAASAAIPPAQTGADSAIENACPAGGCAGNALPPGSGTDGTTGGTGTRPCGGSGQPVCSNGAPSGTTACGGAGQPVCVPTEGEGGEGSAPVCGGPGLPPCAVTDPGAAPVCGGPGLPACATDAKPVCGGPGLPACQIADAHASGLLSQIVGFFTGSSDTASDPVPATAADLKAAGLDGGTTFAELTSWAVPQHASECPTGSFAAFGKTFVLDSHCALARDNFDTFRAVMTLVFALSALFIVLKA